MSRTSTITNLKDGWHKPLSASLAEGNAFFAIAVARPTKDYSSWRENSGMMKAGSRFLRLLTPFMAAPWRALRRRVRRKLREDSNRWFRVFGTFLIMTRRRYRRRFRLRRLPFWWKAYKEKVASHRLRRSTCWACADSATKRGCSCSWMVCRTGIFAPADFKVFKEFLKRAPATGPVGTQPSRV